MAMTTDGRGRAANDDDIRGSVSVQPNVGRLAPKQTLPVTTRDFNHKCFQASLESRRRALKRPTRP